MRTKRHTILISLVLALILLVGALGPTSLQALPRATVQRAMKAVVEIVAIEEGAGGMIVAKWGGSGTIVTEDGLILTNCHVAFPSAMRNDPELDYDALVIGITTRSDEPPRYAYLAEVVQYDASLDLAVIQITHTFDGTPLEAAELNLPTVPLGDSDELEIGDTLSIFGYPSIGGDTLTLTTGNVSGFNRERGVEGRAWIKTDATIAGGNSGGMALSEQGELVGVPTQAGAGGVDKTVDCRPIADTNGDGVINEKDTCVPIGGFLNALRPVNLARPLIDAAKLGLGPKPVPAAGGPTKRPSGTPQVSRPLFTTATDDCDQPVGVVDSFPSGTEEIYLFFDYSNFQDGNSWQPVLYYDGEEDADVWPVYTWNGGESGSWWISLSNDPLADGEYEFVLQYDDKKIGSASVEVGGPERTQPAFSSITFSAGEDEGCLLPAGIGKIEAAANYTNMTSSTKWSYVWYHEPERIAGGDGKPISGSSGVTTFSLTNDQGFDVGTYRLELYIGDRLAGTSDMLLAGETETGGTTGAGPLGPITFGSEVDSSDELVDPGTTFPSGTLTLYGAVDYQGMQDGWEIGRRWSIDGDVVVDSADSWDAGESGENYHFWINSRSGSLPDGEYKLDLLVEGQLAQSENATIGDGSGRTPDPTPIPAALRVEIYGWIRDADTGQGIPGALFLVLLPGISVDDFEWSDEELYASGEADRNGYFELSAPLVRGEAYSLIIGAKGYDLISEDDVTVSEDVESPLEVEFTLQRAQ